jgi:predicted nucleic acid-binding protein
MKRAVIDTNVLVSAFWTADSAPAEVMALVLNGSVIPCYDYRIIEEYREVLSLFISAQIASGIPGVFAR